MELRVEHGLPTDEELAAVVAVLHGLARREPDPPRPPRRVEWSAASWVDRRSWHSG